MAPRSGNPAELPRFCAYSAQKSFKETPGRRLPRAIFRDLLLNIPPLGAERDARRGSADRDRRHDTVGIGVYDRHHGIGLIDDVCQLLISAHRCGDWILPHEHGFFGMNVRDAVNAPHLVGTPPPRRWRPRQHCR